MGIRLYRIYFRPKISAACFLSEAGSLLPVLVGGCPFHEMNRRFLLVSPIYQTGNGQYRIPGRYHIFVCRNGGNIVFGNLDVGRALTLNAKNGDISGAIVGSYDVFSIRSKIKKAKAICRGIKTTAKKR